MWVLSDFIEGRLMANVMTHMTRLHRMRLLKQIAEERRGGGHQKRRQTSKEMVCSSALKKQVEHVNVVLAV